MQYALVAASTLLIASTTYAAHIEIAVGPGQIFDPNEVTAEEGDIISVNFGAGHNIVQSSFDAPCAAMDGGISSGTPEEGSTFSFEVNGTDPLWFYCSVGTHCQNGMALAVNPTTERTIDAYVEAAADVSASTQPASEGAVGGTYEEIEHSDDEPSSTESSADSSSTASSTADAAATETGDSDSGVSSLRSSLGLVAGVVAAGAAFAL